jgi:recombinational DNA repair protein (RecF pathway)
LILASARSARLATSKLRPALQEYSLVNISCIK